MCRLKANEVGLDSQVSEVPKVAWGRGKLPRRRPLLPYPSAEMPLKGRDLAEIRVNRCDSVLSLSSGGKPL
jgi:hypothetical protein